jgi:hypothetical protein
LNVQELGGERRQDQAKRHRQQHVAVGLWQCEPERLPRGALAARQRLDAGTHLLADARGGEEAETQGGGEILTEGRIEVLDPAAGAAATARGY